jgi:hypothetical protein
MTIALDTTTGDNSNSNSRATTVASGSIETGGADRVLVAIIFCVNDNNAGGTAQTVSGVADTAGLTWAKRGSKAWSYTNGGFTIFADIEEWWAHAPSTISSPDTVTATFTASVQQSAIRVVAVQGTNTPSAPFDSHSGLPATADDVTGSSTTPQVAASTSQASDFIIEGIFQSVTSANSAGSGYTRISNLTMGSGDGVTAGWFGVQYQIVSSTISAANQGFAATTTNWGVIFDALTGNAASAPFTQSKATIVC